MTIIRKSIYEDMAEVSRISYKYASETLMGNLSEGHLAAMIAGCTEKGFVLIAEREDRVVGILAGVFVEGFDMGKFFEETIWYVEPEYRGIGLRLYKRALQLCKEANCQGIAMTAYNNKHLDNVVKFYERNGFEEIERRFYKKI